MNRLFVLFIFIAALLSSCNGALFFIDHVRLIEQSSTSGNFLYRGGNPNFVEFEYPFLVNEMKRRAEESNIAFPEHFYMIDVNLENPGDDYNKHHIEDEAKYFKENSDKGEFILHTILGEYENPFDYNSSYVMEKALTFDQWSRDDLPAFVNKLNSIVSETNNTVPVVTYIHCECGCDRTGEVSGSYYMAYMNMSLHDAHDLDKQVAGREMYKYNHYALNWYCFYLKYPLFSSLYVFCV